jgi:hypothetical protein
MGTLKHICQSVEGALRNWKKRDWNAVAQSNNSTATEMENHFWDLHSKGTKVIPIGEPCEGFSYQTGCPGHPTKGPNETP